MYLENENYAIRITIDSTYTVDSADNMPYDFICNPANKKHNDSSQTFHIEIRPQEDPSQEEKTTIALIGDVYSYDSDCAILEADIITILQNQTITQIDLRTKQLQFYKVLNTLGCNFGIYKKHNRYMIYGEIEINCLNERFEIIWSFMGEDVFVSQNEADSFALTEDRIKLNDWSGTYYELDYKGNLLAMRHLYPNSGLQRG